MKKKILLILIAIVLLTLLSPDGNGSNLFEKLTQNKKPIEPIKIDKVKDPHIKNHLNKYCSQTFIDQFKGKSLVEAAVMVEQDLNPEFNLGVINPFLYKCVEDISKINLNNLPFKYMKPKQALNTIALYLANDSGLSYESNAAVPQSYLLSNAFIEKKANFKTMPLIFAMLADKCGFKVSLVNVEGHVFVRYEQGGEKFNISCNGPKYSGISGADEDYIKNYKAPAVTVKNGVNMRSLSLNETIGMMFNNKMQYFYKSSQSDKVIKPCAYALLFNDKDYIAIRTMMSMLLNSAKTPEKESFYNALVDHLNSFEGGAFNKEEMTDAQKKQKRRKEIDALADRLRQDQINKKKPSK